MENLQGFSIMRPGPKLKTDQKRLPLDETEFSETQKKTWKNAQKCLEGQDPEIRYDSLLEIEKIADGIFVTLPDDSVLLFSNTNAPRAKMTSALLRLELAKRISESGKNIQIAFLWEEDDKDLIPLRDIAKEAAGIVVKMQKIMQRDGDDMGSYFSYDFGGRTHDKEMFYLFKTVNEDLASEDSIIRNRAKELKLQVEELKRICRDKFQNKKVFFYGVGHLSGQVALDVAFNGRENYSDVAELPTPLSIWAAKLPE